MIGSINSTNIPRIKIDNEINKLGFEDNNSNVLSSDVDLNEIIKPGKYYYIDNFIENNIKNLPNIKNLNIFTLSVYTIGEIEGKIYIIQEILDYINSAKYIRKIILEEENNIFEDWQTYLTSNNSDIFKDILNTKTTIKIIHSEDEIPEEVGKNDYFYLAPKTVEVSTICIGGKAYKSKLTTILGSSVYLEFIPDKGKIIENGSIKINGERFDNYTIDSNNKVRLYITNITENIEVSARFIAYNEDEPTVKVSSVCIGGKVSTPETYVNIGDSIYLEFTPDEGNNIENGFIKINGIKYEDYIVNRLGNVELTIDNIKEDIDIFVEFCSYEENDPPVEVSVTCIGGTYTNSIPSTISETSLYLEFIPDEGKTITDGIVKINGVNYEDYIIDNNEKVVLYITNISENIDIYVEFV